MDRLGTPHRTRALGLLLLCAGMLAGALRLAATPPPGGPPFTGLLCRLAADTLVVVAAWSCLVAAALLGEALSRGRVRTLRWTGCPPGVRRLLLSACGAALVAGAAAPSYAGDRGSLDGLPLPDRTAGGLPASAASTPRVHVVRPGESLWRIAAELVPGEHTRMVAALAEELHRLNRRTVPDPDVIHPGQRLRLPAPATRTTPEVDR